MTLPLGIFCGHNQVSSVMTYLSADLMSNPDNRVLYQGTASAVPKSIPKNGALAPAEKLNREEGVHFPRSKMGFLTEAPRTGLRRWGKEPGVSTSAKNSQNNFGTTRKRCQARNNGSN
jgi:hypothetical protein